MFNAIDSRRLGDDAPSVSPPTGALEKTPQVSIKSQRISDEFCRLPHPFADAMLQNVHKMEETGTSAITNGTVGTQWIL